ncbi:MAG: hypothetical protein LBU09_02690 [Endomicrobium sp.]|nr:hypothetical protein [Endomicrobium sp.]
MIKVKGLKIPKSCKDCRFLVGREEPGDEQMLELIYTCVLSSAIYNEETCLSVDEAEEYRYKRHEDCPIIEE